MALWLIIVFVVVAIALVASVIALFIMRGAKSPSAQGPKGDQGLRGLSGAPGQAGLRGFQGLKGDPGTGSGTGVTDGTTPNVREFVKQGVFVETPGIVGRSSDPNWTLVSRTIENVVTLRGNFVGSSNGNNYQTVLQIWINLPFYLAEPSNDNVTNPFVLAFGGSGSCQNVPADLHLKAVLGRDRTVSGIVSHAARLELQYSTSTGLPFLVPNASYKCQGDFFVTYKCSEAQSFIPDI